jgi:hypothetical protein
MSEDHYRMTAKERKIENAKDEANKGCGRGQRRYFMVVSSRPFVLSRFRGKFSSGLLPERK